MAIINSSSIVDILHDCEVAIDNLWEAYNVCTSESFIQFAWQHMHVTLQFLNIGMLNNLHRETTT